MPRQTDKGAGQTGTVASFFGIRFDDFVNPFSNLVEVDQS
jgi:hypothetical protein